MSDSIFGGSDDPFDAPAVPLPEPDPALEAEAAEIRRNQEMFSKVIEKLVRVYRLFDKTKRKILKEEMLEDVYVALRGLGGSIGVSSFSLPRLSDC